MEQQDQKQSTNSVIGGVNLPNIPKANTNSVPLNQRQAQQHSQYTASPPSMQGTVPASTVHDVQPNQNQAVTSNTNHEQVKVRHVAHDSSVVNAQTPNRVLPTTTQVSHGASQEHNSQSMAKPVQGGTHSQASNDLNKTLTTSATSRDRVEAELVPPPNMKEPAQAEVHCQIELPLHQKDWEDTHWAAFSRYFNNAENFSEIQKRCNNARKEKIALLVIRADHNGYEIDKGRKAKWLASEEDSRGRIPIVEVCKGEYIRISAKLAEQFGVKLKEGQKYILSASPEGGKAKIELEKLV